MHTEDNRPLTAPQSGPIGVFDSGYGGLTVFKCLEEQFPDYDFVYLGDNARAPYGARSFEAIYRFTAEGVAYLLRAHRCPLLILACNTASARALRRLQQSVLIPWTDQGYRVLGIIRPTIEHLLDYSKTAHVGLLATAGTVSSETYLQEQQKYSPSLKLSQQACPLLVSLIENGERDSDGTRYFVRKYMQALLAKDPLIDTVLLACTHYPLLWSLFQEELPPEVQLLGQGEIVAHSLKDYLCRHPEMDVLLSKQQERLFLTTEEPESFASVAEDFLGRPLTAEGVDITGAIL